MPNSGERRRGLTLLEVVTAVNERSPNRPFGGLPEWRKEHKRKKSLPGTPFYSRLEAGRKFVFHVGGLSELQFNLGFEKVRGVTTFRHGVAFSLRPTREFPSIASLVPKVVRFNEYVHIYPDTFADFEMWNWSHRVRSKNYPAAPIPDSQVDAGSFFVFLGRSQPTHAIDLGLILDDFDRLLPLYEYVEGTTFFPAEAPEGQRKGFVWSPGNRSRTITTIVERRAQTVEKSLRHNAIQPALYKHLKSVYGDSVSGEQLTANGTYIDVAVRHGDVYTYYEIKTGLSAQSCIRDAVGQLLEYSYWPRAQPATLLVIVGEPPLDKDAKAYLKTLRKVFSLPLEYRQFDMNSSRLT